MNPLSVRYLEPSDEIHSWVNPGRWAVPFWGDRRGWGPSGVLFFDDLKISQALASLDAQVIESVDTVLFHRYSSKPQKRKWLDQLGLEATRGGVNRTMIDATPQWVPLLRQRKKAFGLINNFVFETEEEAFFRVTKIDAHVFGDALKLAARRDYATRLGAEVGLVESLRGKPRKK